jgi:DNA-binding PadR family transcriptional regulator
MNDPAGWTWTDVLDRLQHKMTRAAFETWLTKTVAERSDDILTVYTPSPHGREWLENRLRPIIEETVTALAGEPLKIYFVIRAAAEHVNDPGLPPAPALPSSSEPPPALDLLTSNEILNTAWPEPTYTVPNLLPAGLSILAGHPKIGKSWLCLQLARSIALGEPLMGEDVEQGGVLYLALEDSPIRLQTRLQRQSWPADLANGEMRVMLYNQFAEQIGDLNHPEGCAVLARYIAHYKPRLVVIDTLSRAFGGDQNVVNIMTDALAPVHAMAHTYGCAVVLVDHHTKKTTSADAVHNILGSIAKGAIADTLLGLYRQRGESYARLLVTGRDIEDRLLAIRYDPDAGQWLLEGEAASIEITARRGEVLEILDELGRCRLSDIQQVSSHDRSNLFRTLRDLVQAGLVVKRDTDGAKLYELAPEGRAML